MLKKLTRLHGDFNARIIALILECPFIQYFLYPDKLDNLGLYPDNYPDKIIRK